MKFRILILIFLFTLSCNNDEEIKDTDEDTALQGTARIVGYLPEYRFHLSDEISYCKLTHLNLAFANPDSDGNIMMTDIAEVVSDARADNPDIMICISLAGGGLTMEEAANWANLIDMASNRPGFIQNIVNYVLDNGLDGVDVDLEWDHVTSGYSDFILELDVALNAHNKLLTVAFPQIRYSNVTDAALNAFDFINIMSYDAKGPWAPSSPGQHSSFQFSQDGIRFWAEDIGIPEEKLTLGVPFYGYNFVNATTVNAFTYDDMIRANENNANLDQVGTSYYNGIPTITSKVNLANDNDIGGIMIWELGQDSFDEYSLLNTIHEEYTRLRVLTSGLCGNE